MRLGGRSHFTLSLLGVLVITSLANAILCYESAENKFKSDRVRRVSIVTMRRFDFLSRWSGCQSHMQLCTHADRGGQSCAVIDVTHKARRHGWVSRLEIVLRGKSPWHLASPAHFHHLTPSISSGHRTHFYSSLLTLTYPNPQLLARLKELRTWPYPRKPTESHHPRTPPPPTLHHTVHSSVKGFPVRVKTD